MTKFPQTSVEMTGIMAELAAKRAGLLDVVATCDERSREHVVAAEMGDTKAKAALQRIQAEETAAQASLKNLAVAIDEANRHRAALVESELAEQAKRSALATAAIVADLLSLDDEIDDALDLARELFARRTALIQSTRALASAAGSQSIGSALLSYFDRQLSWLSNHGYASITRVAEYDAHAFKTTSARMKERGPRPQTMVEKALLGSIMKSRQQSAA